MIASSPRGTFSQAELAGNRVITRCITRNHCPLASPWPCLAWVCWGGDRTPIVMLTACDLIDDRVAGWLRAASNGG